MIGLFLKKVTMLLLGGDIIEYYGIFGGGGIKGLAYLGALQALKERGFRLIGAGGTSIGAIIASLLVVGYNVDELLDLTRKIDFSRFYHKFSFKQLPAVVKEKGLYSMQEVELFLSNLYLSKNKYYFYQIKNNDGYRLRVTTTPLDAKNLVQRNQLIIPDELPKLGINPDSFPIVKSVIMSSTYPGYYQPVKINQMSFLDGGMKEKLTASLFNDRKGLKIAFKLVKKAMIPYEKKADVYIINIPINKTKTLEFMITENSKKTLLQSGYQATKIWLKDFFLTNMAVNN